MSANLSVLQRNIIHALDCEISATAFLRACDRVSARRAEEFATEVKALVAFVNPALAKASSIAGFETVPDGLLKFIMDRHWNLRFASNRRPVT